MWDSTRELSYRARYVGLGFILGIGVGIKYRGYLLYYVNRYIGEELYYMNVLESIEVMLRLLLVVGCVVVIPLVWLQVWCFLVRGLYKWEGRRLIGVGVVSWILMLVGIKSVEVVLLPGVGDVIGKVLGVEGIREVEYLKMMRRYVSFIEEVTFVMILLTQVPVILWIMKKFGRLRVKRGLCYRKWVYCGTLVVGGVTPDVWSQCVLVLPVWIGYELGMGYMLYEKYKRASRE